MEDITFVDHLICRSQETYKRIVDDYLHPLNFRLFKKDEGERVILGPDGNVYTATYRVFVWKNTFQRRLVWFVLDSQIPHMSSIVACIAFPNMRSSFPLFVMNLNLKRHLGTYSTIIGFRGSSLGLKSIINIIPIVKCDLPSPLFIKKLPEGFKGLRIVFPVNESVIQWSLLEAERSLSHWINITSLEVKADKDFHESYEYLQLYAKEMKELHGRDGRVFDAVFGTGWVSEIFNDNVFGRQEY